MEIEQDRGIGTDVLPQTNNEVSKNKTPHKPIPWYIHALWVGFWVFALWYLIAYQLPVVQEQMFRPQ